jgi:hypothetical protein
MAVGATIGSSQVDNIMSALAVNLRDIMQQIANLNLSVNGQGQGLAYLQSVGYSNVPSAANPGGVSDAALALSVISYLNTMAAIYFGTAAQPSPFNFNNQLSEVWAGRVE